MRLCTSLHTLQRRVWHLPTREHSSSSNVLNAHASSQGCGSAAPHQQRRGNTDLRARSRGIFTHEDALSTCDRGEQVCGVDKGSAGFECLNTNTALESCEWASYIAV